MSPKKTSFNKKKQRQIAKIVKKLPKMPHKKCNIYVYRYFFAANRFAWILLEDQQNYTTVGLTVLPGLGLPTHHVRIKHLHIVHKDLIFGVFFIILNILFRTVLQYEERKIYVNCVSGSSI